MELHGEVPPDRQPAAGTMPLPTPDQTSQLDDGLVRSFLDLVLDLDLHGHES